MDTTTSRIGDRFRKRGTSNYAIRRKMRMLESFVTFLKKKNHFNYSQEKARRVRQIERGILQVTG